MKKVFFVLVMVAMMAILTGCGESTDSRLEGKTYYVVYDSVNVREEPSTSAEILDEYQMGHKVELSGQIYTYSDGPNALWYETSDGYWIIADALGDLADYDELENKLQPNAVKFY